MKFKKQEIVLMVILGLAVVACDRLPTRSKRSNWQNMFFCRRMNPQSQLRVRKILPDPERRNRQLRIQRQRYRKKNQRRIPSLTQVPR